MKKLVFTTSGCVESFCISKLPQDQTDVEATAKLLSKSSSSSNFKELLEELNGRDFFAQMVCGMIRSGMMTDELYYKAYGLYDGNKAVLQALYNTKYTDHHIPADLGEKVAARL